MFKYIDQFYLLFSLVTTYLKNVLLGSQKYFLQQYRKPCYEVAEELMTTDRF